MNGTFDRFKRKRLKIGTVAGGAALMVCLGLWMLEAALGFQEPANPAAPASPAPAQASMPTGAIGALPPVPGSGEGDWAMYRGGQTLAGVAKGELAEKLELKWRFEVKESAPIKSSPAIVKGVVYIGADDGFIYAIDLKDGKKKWGFEAKDPVEAGPLVLDGRVYAGSIAGDFYCLDGQTGNEIWKFAAQDKFTAAANYFVDAANKRTLVLAASHDARLYGLDAVTGQKVWEYEIGSPINGAVSVSAGRAVIGGCDNFIHIVSASDGKPLGKIEVEGLIPASVAAEGDELYWGHMSNAVNRADIKAMKVVWEYRDRQFGFLSSAAIGRDVVLVGGNDKRLHAINRKTGKGVWQFRSRGQMESSPVIVGGKLVVGSDDGRVYLIKLSDGKEVWNYQIGRGVVGSPAVAGGWVVTGAMDGVVYAFGPAGP